MFQSVYNQEYLKRLQLADQQATTRPKVIPIKPPLAIQTYPDFFWRFMEFPTEVITEVLCNVTPFELLSLSHTCKSLREMIMRRNAEYIWSAAERNSATYPSYPWADISKPRFAALLFMMLCTTCGKYTTNPLDPFLLVRLCSKCCSTELVALPQFLQATSTPLWELLPHTSHGMKQYQTRSHCFLRACLCFHITDGSRRRRRRSDLAKRLDKVCALISKNWRVPTRKALKGLGINGQKSEYSTFGIIDLNNPPESRVKRRLRVLGWLEEDFDFTPDQSEEWDSLVHKPTALTDEEWSELYFKLGPLLFSNRTRVQKAQREKNMARQNTLLAEFLATLKADLLWHPLSPFLRALGMTSKSRIVGRFLNSYPFPSNELAKTWPFFSNVGNMEISETELRSRFEGDREQIKAHITSWRAEIEIELANKLMEERGVFTMAEAEPLCRVEVNRSDRATNSLPLYTRLLLRADSVFTDGSSKCAPLYYPEFIPTKPQFVWSHTRPVISVHKFHRAPEPERVARALLSALGLENASYFELTTFGERFICFRCSPRSRKLMSWRGILCHYLDEKRFWNFAVHNGPRFKTINPISMKCAHSLPATGNLPLVDLLTPSCTQLWSSSMSQLLIGEDKYFCLPCKNFGCAFLGTEVKVLKKHMREVHDCASKVVENVHYGLIKEGETFLEAGAAWRTRWNEFNRADSGDTWSEDEGE